MHLDLISRQEEMAQRSYETQNLIDEYSKRVSTLKKEREEIEELRKKYIEDSKITVASVILQHKKIEFQVIEGTVLIALLQRYFSETDEESKAKVLEQMKIQIKKPGA
jgi:Skp family chaperone for outer membrane proteins